MRSFHLYTLCRPERHGIDRKGTEYSPLTPSEGVGKWRESTTPSEGAKRKREREPFLRRFTVLFPVVDEVVRG